MPSENEKDKKGGAAGGPSKGDGGGGGPSKGGALKLHIAEGDRGTPVRADIPTGMEATENSGGPGPAVENPESSGFSLHIAEGDRGTPERGDIPTGMEASENSGGPGPGVENPDGGALKLHINDSERQKLEPADIPKGTRVGQDLVASDIPPRPARTENKGGPGLRAVNPKGGAFKQYIADGDRGERRTGEVPKGEQDRKNEWQGKKAESKKGPEQTKKDAPERPPRNPPVQPKKQTHKKNEGSGTKASSKKGGLSKVSQVLKRPERLLPKQVQKALGVLALANDAAKLLKKIGAGIPPISLPDLPGFANPFAGTPAEMAKIKLEVEGAGEFKFQYNPSQFSMDRAVSWEDSRAMKEPYGILNFTGGSSDTLSFTAMIDYSEGGLLASGSVLADVKKLYGFTKTTVEEANKLYKRPPIVKLVWKDLSFVGVMTALKVDFVMFAEDGTPLRANVTITMMGRSFESTATASSFYAPSSG